MNIIELVDTILSIKLDVACKKSRKEVVREAKAKDQRGIAFLLMNASLRKDNFVVLEGAPRSKMERKKADVPSTGRTDISE